MAYGGTYGLECAPETPEFAVVQYPTGLLSPGGLCTIKPVLTRLSVQMDFLHKIA
jgi:hypothetical protein